MHLKRLREAQGLSLRKLGERSGVHYTKLIKMEAGTVDPRLSTVCRVAKALGVTVSELLGDYPPTTQRRSYGTHQTKRRVVRRVPRPG